MPSSPPRSTLFPYTMLFRSQRANLCTRILCPLLRCGFVPDRRDKTRANKKLGLAPPLHRQLLVVHHLARVEFGSDHQAAQTRGKIHFVVVLAEIEEVLREAEKKNVARSSLALDNSRLRAVLVFGLQRRVLFEVVQQLLVVLLLRVGGAGT